MKYRGKHVPGIKAGNKSIGVAGCHLDGDYVIHLINLHGIKDSITLRFSKNRWKNIEKMHLEPGLGELRFDAGENEITCRISKEQLDTIDTILRISVKD